MSKKSDTNGVNPVNIGPVVSASHLATGAMPSMSEMEFAMTVVHNAFSRWMVRCMTAVGYAGMAPIDVLVLHSVKILCRRASLVTETLKYFLITHV